MIQIGWNSQGDAKEDLQTAESDIMFFLEGSENVVVHVER